MIAGMRLVYFAWLRERVGKAGETLSPPAHVTTVGALLDWLKGQGGSYAEALKDLSAVRVAVNQEYAGPDAKIGANDEVALFPPVTGG
jgi:molybdopterin converting factor subunit 1